MVADGQHVAQVRSDVGPMIRTSGTGSGSEGCRDERRVDLRRGVGYVILMRYRF